MPMKPMREPYWPWKPLKPYNGFTHEDRVRVGQLQHWFMDNGWMDRPEVCTISGGREDVQYHSEDYYHWSSSTYGVARPLHLALHARFWRPAAWADIVRRYSVWGDEWFARLSLEPVDLAGQLRQHHGPGLIDVFAHAPVPAGVMVPRDRMYALGQ
jgi:hypothetical protein